MRRLRIVMAACALALAAAAVPPAGAGDATYDIAPPGVVTQRQTVYLGGEGMHTGYVAVLSRVRRAPAANGRPAVFEPHLTIYAPGPDDGPRFRRIYESPSPHDPLALLFDVSEPPGGRVYLPYTTARIVGAAEFMESGVQQLVVEVHAASADCGQTTDTIVGMDARGKLVARAAIFNACALHGRIDAPPDQRASLVLTGPYYGTNAPLCCPTNPRARSVLRFDGRRWVDRPSYFTLSRTR